ncbi:MAG: DUF2785 domain-containing protein [Sinimarinibacterium sp.]
MSSRLAGLMLAAVLIAPAYGASCPPAGYSRAQLVALKATGFEIADDARRQTLALELLDCLDNPDPSLRDGIAFEAYYTWLRAERIDLGTRRELLNRLLGMLDPTMPDRAGFRRPFAVLALAEVARTDRIAPWMEDLERNTVLNRGVDYFESLRDYRGFDAREGWRHGVAHGADLLTQLALNPAFGKPQLDRLLAALASQIMPPGEHAYTDGEPERLARVLLVAAQRGLHTAEDWDAWFRRLLEPAPDLPWAQAYTSRAGLSRRHNLAAFLFATYVNARESNSPGVEALLPGLRTAIKALP